MFHEIKHGLFLPRVAAPGSNYYLAGLPVDIYFLARAHRQVLMAATATLLHMAIMHHNLKDP